MTKSRFSILQTIVLVLCCIPACPSLGQASATATGPGSYFSVGGGASLFQTDYGQQRIGGAFAVADLHPHWRFGLEGEARWLQYHNTNGLTQSNFLVGPHINAIQLGKFTVYGKFLAGGSHMNFTFNNGSGTFFTMAAGGGLDVHISDRLAVRALDFEYQSWSDLQAFNSLHPYGINVGLIYRVNGTQSYPGRHSRARR